MRVKGNFYYDLADDGAGQVTAHERQNHHAMLMYCGCEYVAIRVDKVPGSQDADVSP